MKRSRDHSSRYCVGRSAFDLAGAAAVRLAIRMLALLTIISLALVNSPAYAMRSIADVDLLGVKIGMTSDEATAILDRHFGRGNVSIGRLPCLKDALKALGNRLSDAPATCIVEMEANGNGEYLTVGLVESLADHEYGSSIVFEIMYRVDSPPTDADAAEFLDHAIKHVDLGPGTEWGGGGFSGVFRDAPLWRLGTSVAWGKTPYDEAFQLGDNPSSLGYSAEPQYAARVSSRGDIEIAAAYLLIRNVNIYRERISQPTVRYTF